MSKIFAANWKLFKTPDETRTYLSKFITNSNLFIKNEIVFFPTAICIEAVSNCLKASAIKWGAQNSCAKNEGAFTGENSAATVKSLGGSYILIGHSERRAIFNESDELLAQKVEAVQALGLTPMFCIGETLQEREAGSTESILKKQLEMGLSKVDKLKPLVVAYEPVWAIGTGKVATAAQVAETHTWVRELLNKMDLKTTPILYGGSVKPENAAELLAQANVSGFLVGGASLDVESFLKICTH